MGCEEFWNLTEPVQLYNILPDMRRLNLREDYDRPMTKVCDYWIDLPGYAQRDPGWDWQRWEWPASSSNSSATLGRGYKQPGDQSVEDPLQRLFELKTAQRKSDPTNHHMQRGIDNEDEIARMFAEEYDMTLIEMPMIFGGTHVRDGVVKRVPGWSQLGVSLDRTVVYDDRPGDHDKNSIVEIKCPERITPYKWKSYYDQVQYQMMISGATLCYLVQGRPAAISQSGEDEMRVDPIPRDWNWEPENVMSLVNFVEKVRHYRRSNNVSFKKYLELKAA